MVSNAENGPSAHGLYAAAQDRVRAGDLRGSLRVLFDLFLLEPFHPGGLAAAARLTRHLGSAGEAALFAAVAERPDDPQSLYDLGYTFVESGLPALGGRYLERCAEVEPQHVLVRYELAYARFLAGDYSRAAPLFEQALADDSLAGPESFSAGALLVECLLHGGDPTGARRAFERLEANAADSSGEAQLDALAQLLARAALFPEFDGQEQRDQLFVEQGGAILRVSMDVPPAATAGVEVLAGMLRRLACLLQVVGRVPQEVGFLDPATRPVAAAFARFLGIAAVPFAPESGRRSLLVVRDPAEAESSLEHLQNHDESLDLFALVLDCRRAYAILPEIVGQFAAGLVYPWEERPELSGAAPARTPADPAVAERAADEIVRAAVGMTGDEGDLTALREYYEPLREHLVLGNCERYPARRMCTPRRAARLD